MYEFLREMQFCFPIKVDVELSLSLKALKTLDQSENAQFLKMAKQFFSHSLRIFQQFVSESQ